MSNQSVRRVISTVRQYWEGQNSASIPKGLVHKVLRFHTTLHNDFVGGKRKSQALRSLIEHTPAAAARSAPL